MIVQLKEQARVHFENAEKQLGKKKCTQEELADAKKKHFELFCYARDLEHVIDATKSQCDMMLNSM